jgi:hypothetical protein
MLYLVDKDLDKFATLVDAFVDDPTPENAQHASIDAILPYQALLDVARDYDYRLLHIAEPCLGFYEYASKLYETLLAHAGDYEDYAKRADVILGRRGKIAYLLSQVPLLGSQ